MDEEVDLESLKPHRCFDGGDMDCGSGLILLIRQHMQDVPAGQVMEMRSREPTVAAELPPWCRMVGHRYLGQLAGEGFQRFFILRSPPSQEEKQAFEADKQRARDYAWRLRARSQGQQTVSVYCRNFSWKTGQPASFEEKDTHPSAIECLLGSLVADLAAGFATHASRLDLEIDDLEISVQGRLHNTLAHLGLEEGDPSLAEVKLICYASSFDEAAEVESAWDETMQRSPVLQTLKKAVSIDTRLSLV